MSRPFIVVPDGFDKELFAKLKAISEFEVHPESKLTQEKLKELLPRVNGLVIRSATTVTAEMVDLAPNLKYVIRAGEGTDNIDKKYCQQKGVKVSNTPGANSNSAAEHAIALMFTVLRKTAWANESMKRGEWDKNSFAGNEVANKTVGFLGFGKIGQIVARRLAGFEPKILFFDPTVNSTDIPYAERVNDIKEVFKKSDIITMHLPKIDSTKNLVNKDLLKLMKPSAILINAARGGIVNEADLYEILAAKKILGAGFDVFATEPLDKDSKLRTLPNLVLTPHLGASTDEAQLRVGEIAIEELREFFINGKLLNEVRS
ncbi:MAG: hypothetical protein A2504_12325 [Bdellovibrionales bacterium RIFOXYD12_FULL_39_22]|nr:MAG: hypothetical protein A2385_09330 [Bdellovibrionales bacterium RIFOXYB1_FULL_39_21]OFZ44975.1 MAG: hypothetical protein A2485_14405 [Bdellovibrionales bacterium RIFOXYC12_FULL_39_17]OFZ49154.1 MAG: hypothetical protein A2404_07905 [Bdellovibrionales bacterium RIFOXYC1_FULL_39_130]OFZ76957.1 MAG: hypothetical protein A2560_03930 [Bdellovibrionales bacterium RIFOXYD1_FULL_39_84]OFZ96147.1 MAG: hypothetical protein A2504_12325 [Bdellovibrionales bacterium RIFOXYD12_FULL_39_22]HLE12105.1 hy